MDNVEQPNPNLKEVGSTGFLERLRKRIKRSKPETVNSDKETLPASNPIITDKAASDLQRIEEIERSLEALTPKPDWAEKDVDIRSINVHELPINWQALNNLGRAINQLKDAPFEIKDLSDIKPPSAVYPALPMVASVIAHKRNPEISVALPTQADVKAMKPWLTIVERFIGRLSENWARRFGSYVERRGQQVVMDVGSQISNIAEKVKLIKDPKQQFLRELTSLYKQLTKTEYQTSHEFFGEEFQEKVSIEEKIKYLIMDLRYIRDGGNHALYTKDQYPLFTTICPIIKFPPDSLDENTASIAGAELMEGIETFLKQQGISGITPAPKAREVNLFDPDSWSRGLAEWFASEKLERVKAGLPNILTQAYHVLPSNGPQLIKKVYDIAENICILKAQGISPEEIARHIFTK